MSSDERRKLIQHMMRELEHPAKSLTPWEANFLESVSDLFTDRGALSQKQFDLLERIYAEKTA